MKLLSLLCALCVPFTFKPIQADAAKSKGSLSASERNQLETVVRRTLATKSVRLDFTDRFSDVEEKSWLILQEPNNFEHHFLADSADSVHIQIGTRVWDRGPYETKWMSGTISSNQVKLTTHLLKKELPNAPFTGREGTYFTGQGTYLDEPAMFRVLIKGGYVVEVQFRVATQGPDEVTHTAVLSQFNTAPRIRQPKS